jgi:hypothetical protein
VHDRSRCRHRAVAPAPTRRQPDREPAPPSPTTHA